MAGISLPKGVPEKTPFVQENAGVLAHEPASSRYFHLRLHSPEMARRAQPGQFALLACRPGDPPGSDPLLPRPLAFLDADPEAGNVTFLYFVAGRGTALLRRTAERALALSQNVTRRVIGPLGRGFTALPDVEAHVALGGGSGVAPLAFFFRRLAQKGGLAAQTPRHLVLGARRGEQLARAELVASPGTRLHQATDDGSAGFRGNAVEALRALLDAELKGKRAALYAAGPEPMMEAAAALARRQGWPCRVSLEARMACGVGVCRSCVVDALRPHPETGLKRRAICRDGPVFDPGELAGIWSARV